MTQVEIYQSEDGALLLPVSVEQEIIWLSLAQMCELFDKNKRTISVIYSKKVNCLKVQLSGNSEQLQTMVTNAVAAFYLSIFHIRITVCITCKGRHR